MTLICLENYPLSPSINTLFAKKKIKYAKVRNKICIHMCVRGYLGFPSCSSGEESACNAGNAGSIPGSGRPLEKEIAIYSSILAWRIPWTEEPDRLHSVGLQRVRYDWAHTHTHKLTEFTLKPHFSGCWWFKMFCLMTDHLLSYRQRVGQADEYCERDGFKLLYRN